MFSLINNINENVFIELYFSELKFTFEDIF